MNVLSKFFVVVVCFFCLVGVGYSEENSGEGEARALDEEPPPRIRERDPFRFSPEFFKEVARPEELVFFKGEDLKGLDLPRIRVTGVMVVDGRGMATAYIETLGEVTLKPGEKIIVKPGRGRKDVLFLVREITSSELAIVLAGGREIRGRFR